VPSGRSALYTRRRHQPAGTPLEPLGLDVDVGAERVLDAAREAIDELGGAAQRSSPARPRIRSNVSAA